MGLLYLLLTVGESRQQKLNTNLQKCALRWFVLRNVSWQWLLTAVYSVVTVHGSSRLCFSTLNAATPFPINQECSVFVM